MGRKQQISEHYAVFYAVHSETRASVVGTEKHNRARRYQDRLGGSWQKKGRALARPVSIM
jgi:hypothetical protein